MKKVVVLGLAVLLATGIAQAILTDGSFEDNTLGAWPGWASVGSGWTRIDTDASDGTWCMEHVNGGDGFEFTGYLTNMGSYPAAQGQTHTLSFDAKLLYLDPEQIYGGETYIEIRYINAAYDAVLASKFFILPYSAYDTWQSFSFSSDPAPAGTTYVDVNVLASWYGDDYSTAGLTQRFDNFVLVPEPATMAILSMGALFLARRKR